MDKLPCSIGVFSCIRIAAEVLIICPACMRLAWVEELETWLPALLQPRRFCGTDPAGFGGPPKSPPEVRFGLVWFLFWGGVWTILGRPGTGFGPFWVLVHVVPEFLDFLDRPV